MLRLASYLIVRSFTSIAILVFSLYFICNAHPAQAVDSEGIKSEDFTFADAHGAKHSLKDYFGKFVVINLWATWCGPCVKEMPSLARLQIDYKDKGLAVLAISEDHAISDAIDFYNSHAISAFEPLTDTDHHIMQLIGAQGIPTSVLVDKNGKIVKILEGDINWQSPEITQAMNEWLK